MGLEEQMGRLESEGQDEEKDGERVEIEQQAEEEIDGDKPVDLDEPFGDGSTHTTTARWVAKSMLPGARWYDGSAICEGVGWSSPALKD